MKLHAAPQLISDTKSDREPVPGIDSLIRDLTQALRWTCFSSVSSYRSCPPFKDTFLCHLTGAYFMAVMMQINPFGQVPPKVMIASSSCNAYCPDLVQITSHQDDDQVALFVLPKYVQMQASFNQSLRTNAESPTRCTSFLSVQFRSSCQGRHLELL